LWNSPTPREILNVNEETCIAFKKTPQKKLILHVILLACNFLIVTTFITFINHVAKIVTSWYKGWTQLITTGPQGLMPSLLVPTLWQNHGSAMQDAALHTCKVHNGGFKTRGFWTQKTFSTNILIEGKGRINMEKL
jgi:hypothetical protein